MKYEALINEARVAQKSSYAPYSSFNVGAAVFSCGYVAFFSNASVYSALDAFQHYDCRAHCRCGNFPAGTETRP